MLDLNEDTLSAVNKNAALALQCFKKRPNAPTLQAGELFYIVAEPAVQKNLFAEGVLSLSEETVSIISLEEDDGHADGYAFFMHKKNHDNETKTMISHLFEPQKTASQNLLGNLPQGSVYVMRVKSDNTAFCVDMYDWKNPLEHMTYHGCGCVTH